MFQLLKYNHGNKERSIKSLTLVFFKRTQRNYFVMSFSPVSQRKAHMYYATGKGQAEF